MLRFRTQFISKRLLLCSQRLFTISPVILSKSDFDIPNISAELETNSKSVNQFSDSTFSSKSDFDIPSLPADIITNPVDLNALGEATFQSLGLNHWTPTGLVQFIFENVHIYTGLPWWACIVASMLIVRTAMLPIQLRQKIAFSNLTVSSTECQNCMYEAIKAHEEKDTVLMMAKIEEMQNGNHKLGKNMKSLLLPTFIQGGVFLSLFTAMRGISEASITGLKTGGLWWFTDLSVHDPLFLLPAITAGSLALVLFKDMNVSRQVTVNQTMLWGLRIMPFIVFLFVSQFPATMVLFWSSSNVYSLVFAYLCDMSGFRNFLNIPAQQIMKINNPNNYTMKDFSELSRSLAEAQIREQAEEKRWTVRGNEDRIKEAQEEAKKRIEWKKRQGDGAGQ